jgi:hypothetical protein
VDKHQHRGAFRSLVDRSKAPACAAASEMSGYCRASTGYWVLGVPEAPREKVVARHLDLARELGSLPAGKSRQQDAGFARRRWQRQDERGVHILSDFLFHHRIARRTDASQRCPPRSGPGAAIGAHSKASDRANVRHVGHESVRRLKTMTGVGGESRRFSNMRPGTSEPSSVTPIGL